MRYRVDLADGAHCHVEAKTKAEAMRIADENCRRTFMGGHAVRATPDPKREN